MLRAVFLSLLLTIVQNTSAVGQRPAFPDKAEPAMRAQDTFRLGAMPGARRLAQLGVLQITTAEADLKVEATQHGMALAVALTRLHNLGSDPSRIEVMNSVVKRLQKNAEARISAKATPEQRAKLRAAATLDIHHRTTEFKSRTENEGVLFLNQLARAGGIDIFGPESLFAKVISHQSLR